MAPPQAPGKAMLRLRQAAPVQDPAEFPRLIQELQLNKIELEMQNDELQRVQADLERSRLQLDQRVMERTAELAQAVERLSSEVQLRYQAEVALRAAVAELETGMRRLKRENARLSLRLD